MPQIYWCEADELREYWQQGTALLTEKRREKTLRLVREEDRLLSLGTGLMLKAVLKISSDDEIKYNEHGKPYFEHGDSELEHGGRNFEHGLHFSISHSENIAVLAVSNDEIGVDIEKLRAPNPAVIRRCFTEEEALRAQTSAESFTRLWTEKEAVLKLLGTGFSLSPKSFCLAPRQEKYSVLSTEFRIFRTEINNMPLSAAFCGSDSAFTIKKLSAAELLGEPKGTK